MWPCWSGCWRRCSTGGEGCFCRCYVLFCFVLSFKASKPSPPGPVLNSQLQTRWSSSTMPACHHASLHNDYVLHVVVKNTLLPCPESFLYLVWGFLSGVSRCSCLPRKSHTTDTYRGPLLASRTNRALPSTLARKPNATRGAYRTTLSRGALEKGWRTRNDKGYRASGTSIIFIHSQRAP